MKKRTLALSAALLLSLGSQATAQINDVTFTASPTAGYTWWHKDLGLGDAPFWGVRAGFSFGPILELRASYDRTFDLKRTLEASKLSLLNSLGTNLDKGYTATAERIGGELKANLWTGTILTPYLTAGAGVLNLDRHFVDNTGGKRTEVSLEDEHLYGTLGAGLKINLGKRVALALEAKNMLLNTVDLVGKSETLQNWGGQASVDFYLGGRTRSDDAVSRAYREVFTDGFRGIKLVLEPGIAYLNFNKNSVMHDQWLMGGSVGVDFSSLVGVRGFYYAATENPKKLQFKFNNALKLYGGNLITRLSQPNGVTPYLTLGGGYMDVTSDKYVDVKGEHGAKSGWFAMGGAGIEIPLHPVVALYGNINAMLNEQDNPDISKVVTTSQVNVNVLYQTGVRFNIGALSRNPEKAYRSSVYEARMAEHNANMEALNNLRSEYGERITELNEQLAEAAKQRDTVKIITLAEKRDEVKKTINKVQAQIEQETQRPIVVEEPKSMVAAAAPSSVGVVPTQTVVSAPKTVVMTSAQLEEMIARVASSAKVSEPVPVANAQMSDLDKILLYSALSNGQRLPALQQFSPAAQPAAVAAPQTVEPKNSKTEEALLNRLEQLEEKLNTTYEAVLRQRVEQAERDAKLRVIQEQPTAQVQPTMLTQRTGHEGLQIVQLDNVAEEKKIDSKKHDVRVVTVTDDKVETKNYTLKRNGFLTFRAMSLFAGLGLGDDTSFNLGVRPEYQMGKTAFYLAPEAFVGLGSSTNFGLSANALYKFGAIKQVVSPYVGLGLGYNHIGSINRFGLNTIVGVTFNQILGGKLFVDYTLRPEFKNHQIAVGYQLSF